MHLMCLLLTGPELCSVLEEREGLATHCEQLERRTQAVLTDYEQEKKDKFAVKVRERVVYSQYPVPLLLSSCTLEAL